MRTPVRTRPRAWRTWLTRQPFVRTEPVKVKVKSGHDPRVPIRSAAQARAFIRGCVDQWGPDWTPETSVLRLGTGPRDTAMYGARINEAVAVLGLTEAYTTTTEYLMARYMPAIDAWWKRLDDEINADDIDWRDIR